MPDIGMIELLLIGLVAFLVLGPERLPDFFAQVAKFVRQGREWMNQLKSQLDQEKQQLTKPVEQIKQDIHDAIEVGKSPAPSQEDKT